jgi:hypothetical protein
MSTPLQRPKSKSSSIKESKAGIANFRPNQTDIFWRTLHTKSAGKCKGLCSNSNLHYRKWREAYEPYLRKYFDIFTSGLPEKSSKASFDLFTEFAFSNSSGYISPYV